jgi:4-hydroxybenzoate polyprenyltransferase
MKRRRTFSMSGLLKLTRFPNLLILGLTQYMAVIFLVAHPEEWPGSLLDPNLFLLSSATILIAAAGYIINDYYDVKIDYVNKPDRVVVGRVIRRRVVLASHILFNLAGVLIGLFLDPKIGFLNFMAAVLLWAYSNQLKRLPFIGNFAIALLTGLTLVAVAMYYERNVHLLLIYAVFAFSLNLIREIIKDMEDVKGDERFGSRTLPIVWGLRPTKRLLYLLTAAFVVVLVTMAFRLQNEILNYFFVGMIVPLLVFIYLLYRADTQRRFRRLSAYCKILMLAGIASMAFF